ncbi:magnesium and cobalt efflux protein CorC [Saccharopolyspora erythraea NRRL 2338]|uniref:Magnesium and cobalt efflux protein CorC n=1 Tax=Saccharopolyspora erythraea (strain ATCC 11635 / DSM 40517 / JCM 4748 / NBRC 13426 / NCIMB 8594 / NRRL 2338) TaxID=405948 RepID=A4FLP3_SACEN|nr:membrane protein [Saccharopolyspora erythraea D]CAM04968.1 magnesium and cobalt efflux protein CorC [Saccharopolyspora erythraea NRRL 2338]
MVLNIGLVLLFVLLGGYFAAAEIALVSLREGQVRRLEGAGRRGARVAKLRADSNRFLSAVQIGVTFAGFFASSYGGATIAVRLSPALEGWGLPAALAATVALVLVTLFVSYLSLVLGELAPKRLALQRTEQVALLTAGVLDRLATLCRPLIWLLSRSTNAVVRLVGIDPRSDADKVTQEELRDMVRTNEQLTVEERKLLTDAFEAGDRVLSEVMIPRTEVDFLDRTMSLADAVAKVRDQPHSRYPVIRDTADDVVGFLHVRDLLTTTHDNRSGARTIGDLARPVTSLPGSKPVLSALTVMRRRGGHLAVVVDEYGGTAGIVTVEDLVEEVVGEIWDEYDTGVAPVRPSPEGSYELDGMLHRSEVEEHTGISLPDGPFDTLAGFVMAELGRMPAEGDAVEALGHRFTVRELDGRRIARVLITPLGDG